MQLYDDYAMNPENFEVMAKEYKSQESRVVGLGANVCKIDSNDIKSVFEKIEYLKVLISNLKNHTSNVDALKVLDDISLDVSMQSKNLSNLFGQFVQSENEKEEDIKIFCNNLKLAINTTGEIVKILVKIKDADETFELSQNLTNSINNFIDMNNQLVSLFGECRYRAFGTFGRKNH